MMRYLFALLLGFLAGVAVVAAVVYYNPATATNESVITRTTDGVNLELLYGSQSGDALAYTNSGSSHWPRVPAAVADLWHPALVGVHVAVHPLQNGRGEPVGVGVKFFQLSEDTRLLRGEVLVDSAWSVMLPGAGSLFVEQDENYWPFVRAVGLPAWLDGNKRWQGEFRSELTVGPRGTLEGVVVGASGVMRDRLGEARESMSVQSYGLGASHDPRRLEVSRSMLLSAREPQPQPPPEVTAAVDERD